MSMPVGVCVCIRVCACVRTLAFAQKKKFCAWKKSQEHRHDASLLSVLPAGTGQEGGPHKFSVVVDACAAPGNKASHLGGTPPRACAIPLSLKAPGQDSYAHALASDLPILNPAP